MSYDHESRGRGASGPSGRAADRAPGKRTLTSRLPVQRKTQQPTAAAEQPETGYHGAGAETLGLDSYQIWGFAVSSAELPPGVDSTVGLAASVTMADRKASIELEGHTSASGAERYNQGLSDERAHAAREALVTRGVERDRITPRGLGESQPLFEEHDDPAAMAHNRRVEIHILGLDAATLKKPTPPPPPPPSPPPGGSPQDSGPGCKDLQLTLLLTQVEKEAWNQFLQEGGDSLASGLKDPGGDEMAPSRDAVRRAANAYHVYEIKQLEYFESTIKLPLGANLLAHMNELDRQISSYQEMLRNHHGCDPTVPLGITLDDLAGITIPKKRDQYPEPNGTAPHGQRY